MDQAVLVDNQIDEGREYVEHLRSKGIDVAAALWLKVIDDWQWYLYIASNIVDADGPYKAYRLVGAATSDLSTPWIDRFQVKLVGVKDSLTQDVLAFQSRYPAPIPTRYRGPKLGGLDVEDAYIYPPFK